MPNLPLAVDENFLRQQIRRNLRLKDSICVRLPVQIFKPDAAADDRFLILVVLKNNRQFFCARIFGGENKRHGQIVSAAAQKTSPCFCRIACCARGEHYGFPGIRHLSAGGQRRPIPQLLNIAQGGWIVGVALKHVLKLFAGLLEFSLFV